MSTKPSVVLTALLNGQQVQLGNHFWCLSEEYDLCMVALTSSGEERLLSNPMDLGEFIRLCNQLSDEAVVIISADITLNKLRDHA